MNPVDLILLLLLLLGLAALLAALLRAVRADGLGHRPPPAARITWDGRVRSY